MMEIQRGLSGWGVHGGVHCSVIDRRHVLVNFSTEADFMKIYTREKWIMKGQGVKVFRWSPWFRPGMECDTTPVWVSLPSLPQCYYKPGFIRSLAKAFGPLLSMATLTSTKSTAVCARLCVDLDLTKEYPSEFYVGTEAKGSFQPIVLENRPPFCVG